MIIWILLLILLLILVVLVARTFMFRSRQLRGVTADELPFDQEKAVKRLSGAIQIKTLSFAESGEVDGRPFDEFHQYIERHFPNVHRVLKRETIAGHSLLYTWMGKNTAKLPVLLMAHIDVVPVVEEEGKPWTRPAFSGEVFDDFIWGRGTLDDKGSLMSILEAVEALLENGFTPERTVYLAFGHDEEVGGDKGAAKIAETLQTRGVRLEYVLDEGGSVVESFIGNLDVAVIGIAEKGYVTVKLTAEGVGGHSSQPPEHTAIGVLAEAIRNIEAHPRPLRTDGVLSTMLDYIGPEMSFGLKLVLANRWLFNPLLKAVLSNKASLKAMMHTTRAFTLVSGGIKDNILPSSASAWVNCRILPGETVEETADFIRKAANNPELKIEIGEEINIDPSPVSSIDSQPFQWIQKSVSQIFPQAVAAPYLVLGGTDSKHFQPLTEAVFRFSPSAFHVDDLSTMHGRNERIGVLSYRNMVRFYMQLLKNTME